MRVARANVRSQLLGEARPSISWSSAKASTPGHPKVSVQAQNKLNLENKARGYLIAPFVAKLVVCSQNHDVLFAVAQCSFVALLF